MSVSPPVPQAAVIIPHYDDADRLARCLAALMPQIDGVAGRTGDVVVVDNGTPNGVGALPDGVRLVVEPQKGAAAARNRGVAETTAPWLFFLDADCVPDVDWLATARQVAGQGDVVGGAIALFDETPGPRSGAEAFETVFAFDNRRYIEQMGFSVTANLLTRRDVFEAVGGFVPGLSEDLDWCHRARAQGFSLVHAEGLKVSHPTRGDWVALNRKWRRLTTEGFGVNGQGGLARLRWGAKALAMVPSIAVHAPKVLRHPALRNGGERWRALLTLARLRLYRCGWMLRQAAGGRI